MGDYKVIYDPVHGTIKVNGVLLAGVARITATQLCIRAVGLDG